MTAQIMPPTSSVEPGEIRILLAVASVNYLYNRFNVALDIVSFAEHLAPTDPAVIELKIVLLSELSDHEGVLQNCVVAEKILPKMPAEITACRKVAQRALNRRTM